MGITTHVLDTASGRPVAGLPVKLEREDAGRWILVGEARTDADGRAKSLVPAASSVAHGTYRLTFDVRAHHGADAFFPSVQITFVVRDERHHHVPLLLAPFGYSTYRGT